MFKSFSYTPILTKEQIQNSEKRKGKKALNMGTTLKRIWKIVDEQRLTLLLVLAFVLLTSICALAGPFLIGQIIDRHIVTQNINGLTSILIALIFVYIAQSILQYLQNYFMVNVAQQTVLKMRQGLFHQFQKLPISFYDKKQHGELMSRMTNDMDNVSTVLNSTFIEVFSSVLIITGTLAVMLWLSPLLTLLTLFIIPIMFFATRWITKRTTILFKKQQQALGDLNGMVEETISGQYVVKAYSQEARMHEQFLEKSRTLKHTGYWANIYSGGIPKVMNFLNNASFALVAGVGGVLALNGYVTVGTIVVFAEYARQFTRPLNELANQFNNVLSAIAGAERVFEIIDEVGEKDLPNERSAVARLNGHITFENVTFRYEKNDAMPTINDVSLTISAGQTAALVGSTGAGKTTIMQLLARFYDVDKGAIKIDAQDIRSMTRQALRHQMAFVLQEPFLFEMSIKENIRYGKLDATDEEIIEACKKANAHTFIEKLAGGYDFVLTEGGGGISQGQKQLLSIARAFIADPAILLLDEATSSIDTVTELEIQSALEMLMQGRTSVVIAHRLNTIKKADIIFVMQHGMLIEQGSREQLIEAEGMFYTMLQQEK